MNAQAGLIAVVGPSGVGKDSVIDGVLAKITHLKLVKRTMTREPGLGGEDYHSIDETEFKAATARGEFCLHWTAHGLYYGIPIDVLHGVKNGGLYIANLSRSVLTEASEKFPNLTIVCLTAKVETLAARLAQRGRENETDIRTRLDRKDYALPPSLPVHTISNDGALSDTVDAVVDVIHSSLSHSS